MKISGMADRANSEIMRLGPDVEVPDEVWVTENFAGQPVGRAKLRRDENGDIYATAEIWDERTQKIIADPRCKVDHFAVSVQALDPVPPGTLTLDIKEVKRGVVAELAVTDCTIDPGLPPFVVDEP